MIVLGDHDLMCVAAEGVFIPLITGNPGFQSKLLFPDPATTIHHLSKK